MVNSLGPEPRCWFLFCFGLSSLGDLGRMTEPPCASVSPSVKPDNKNPSIEVVRRTRESVTAESSGHGLMNPKGLIHIGDSVKNHFANPSWGQDRKRTQDRSTPLLCEQPAPKLRWPPQKISQGRKRKEERRGEKALLPTGSKEKGGQWAVA